jgi:hypothetical protein
MTPDEALDIIGQYGGVIGKSIINRKSELPCTKAKIKQAYFTYLPELYKQDGGFYQKIVDPLVACYGMLNSFMDDDEADEIETIKKQADAKQLDYDTEQGKEQADKYINYERSKYDGNLLDEINEYIGEIQRGKQ